MSDADTPDLADTGGPSIDAARFRQVMGHFCTGITVITAIEGGQPVGFTAQSFQSLSLEPPLVSFAPAKSSSSWPRIEAAGEFCVNILAEDQEELCRRFAMRGADKFAGVGYRPAPRTGAPQLTGSLAWIECRIQAVHDAGDHVICVGRVLDMGVEREEGPLLFYRGGYGRFEI